MPLWKAMSLFALVSSLATLRVPLASERSIGAIEPMKSDARKDDTKLTLSTLEYSSFRPLITFAI